MWVSDPRRRPVDDGEASYPDDEAAGFGDDFPAVDDGEPREVYDEGEAAGFGEDEVATRPVEGGAALMSLRCRMPCLSTPARYSG